MSAIDEPRGSRSGLRFNLFGVPVRIDNSFWILVGLFAFQYAALPGGVARAAAFVVLVLTGLLIHELGHALSFRAFGRDPQVTLYAMGGLTAGGDQPLPPWRDLVVSIAGPLFGIAVGAAAWLWLQLSPPGDELLRIVVADAVFVNLGWSILNLAPLLPLDGGRTVQAFLRAVVSDRRAERWARMVSIVTGVALGLLALQIGSLFGVIIVAFLVMMNVTALTQSRGDAARTQRASAAAPAANRDPEVLRHTARTAMTREERDGAARQLLEMASVQRDAAMGNEAFALVGEPTPRDRALAALANRDRVGAVEAVRQHHAMHGSPESLNLLLDVAWRAGWPEAAAHAVAATPDHGLPPTLKSADWLLRTGHARPAGRLAARTFAVQPSGPAALVAAKSAAQDGADDVAVAWLQRAAEHGAVTHEVLADPAFGRIAHHPAITALRR